MRSRRHDVFEKLEPFRDQVGVRVGQARGVATGARKTGHESSADGIGLAHEHDGNRARDFLGRERAAGRCRDENIHLEAEELGRECGQPVDVPRRISQLDDDVLTLDIAKRPKPIPKGREPAPGLVELARREREIPDPPGLSRLRVGDERRGKTEENDCDEAKRFEFHGPGTPARRRREGISTTPSRAATYRRGGRATSNAYFRRPAMCSPTRSALAMIVSAGFTAALEQKKLPSTT